MTPSTLNTRTARAIEIKKIIATLDEELDAIKDELTLHAQANPEEHQRTDGGGWSWRFVNNGGDQVCVTQPAPKLKSRINPESKGFDKIKDGAGRSFMQLFMQVPAYAPVEEFRVKALAYLGKDVAKKLIKLVTSESAVSVSFEVAKSEGVK